MTIIHKQENHYHCSPEIVEVLKDISKQLKTIQMDQLQLAAKLRDLKAQNDKATAEQLAALKKLQDALANQGNTTPEVDAALEDLSASIQRDDDLNEDEAGSGLPDEPQA